MFFVGHDPGKSAGWACVDGKGYVNASPMPRNVILNVPHVIIVEGQWAAKSRKGSAIAGKASLASLAFRAGFETGLNLNPFTISVVKLEPKIWKPKIFRGGDRMPKEVFNERLRRSLDPNWQEILKGLPEDCTDAIGLALAGAKLTEKELKKYEYWKR